MTMTLNTLTGGEAWMTPQERELNHEFIQSTTELLATRGVPETPLILIRVNDVIVTWLLARRLETALAPAEGETAPCPTPAQAGAIGKCRDRLRRAIKELEACCPRGAAPAGNGLGFIEHMHEAVGVVQAAGILDEPAAAPTENGLFGDPASDPPETRGSTATPNPPRANPIEAPPPPNRKARRLQAREERRNRIGPSKTATMGTYPRTKPPLERHPRIASTQNKENGSELQRGGMSRPG